MLFNKDHLQSETLEIEGLGEYDLFEVSALDRAKTLDLYSKSEASDSRSEQNLEANIFLVYSSLKPGLSGESKKAVCDELKGLSQKHLDKFIDKAMMMAGFDIEESDGGDSGK